MRVGLDRARNGRGRARPGEDGGVLGVVLPRLLVGKASCVFVLCDLVKADKN